MSSSPNSGNFRFSWLFGLVLGMTIAVWLLRGFGILTFIPSGVIWILLLLCAITAILSYLQSTRW